MTEEEKTGGQPTQQGVPAVTVRDPLIGVVVIGYQILRVLGGGGMGTAYLAYFRSGPIARYAALKFLHDDLATPEVVRRFDREAAIMAQLGYPCVQVFDHGMYNGRRFLAMEYIHGITLAKFKDTNFNGVPIPYALAIFIAIMVLRGLMDAHRKGIVHRDVKAENVMLSVGSDGRLQVRIIDFGIGKGSGSARRSIPSGDTTQIGMVIGTPDHMSPEQARALPVDARTDQYALAVMLYELLAGVLPFTAGDQMSLFAAILTAPMPPFADGTVPQEVAACVERALAKKPEDRFPDGLAFADALQAASGVDLDKASLLSPELRAMLTLPPMTEDLPQDEAVAASAAVRQPTTGVVSVSDTEQRRVGAQRRSRVVLGVMTLVGAMSFIGGLALVLSRGPASNGRATDAGMTSTARQMPDANASHRSTAIVSAFTSDASVRTDAFVPADVSMPLPLHRPDVSTTDGSTPSVDTTSSDAPSGVDAGVTEAEASVQPTERPGASHRSCPGPDRRRCTNGATDFRPRLGCQAQCVGGCWRCN